MPFRARLKKTFSRSNSGSDSSLTHSNTNQSRTKDSNVYQPGEKMPPMKYRRPVAKEHKEHLEAFDFSKAWRRRSHQSLYSPRGSRLPSLVGSAVGGGAGASRNGSVTSAGAGGPGRSFASPRADSVEMPQTGEESAEEAANVANGEMTSDEGSSAASEVMTERTESFGFPRQ